jgi:hypothetical protein
VGWVYGVGTVVGLVSGWNGREGYVVGCAWSGCRGCMEWGEGVRRVGWECVRCDGVSGCVRSAFCGMVVGWGWVTLGMGRM